MEHWVRDFFRVLDLSLSLRCEDSIITYVLLCGYTPFRSDDPKELVRETARGRIEFHAPYWNNVSEEGTSSTATFGTRG